jgi:hypothetical protein
MPDDMNEKRKQENNSKLLSIIEDSECKLSLIYIFVFGIPFLILLIKILFDIYTYNK